MTVSFVSGYVCLKVESPEGLFRMIYSWIDAIAQAQSETGNFDMRNALAHLQEVTTEDIKRFGEYNIMAVFRLSRISHVQCSTGVLYGSLEEAAVLSG